MKTYSMKGDHDYYTEKHNTFTFDIRQKYFPYEGKQLSTKVYCLIKNCQFGTEQDRVSKYW